MNNIINGIKKAFQCRCPQCNTGKLYQSLYDLRLHEKCDCCGLILCDNDSADGPAVFLIFILGFLIVPLALWVDALFDLTLWMHGIIWTVVILAFTIGFLKPLKTYVLMLQFKHRKDQWDDHS